MAINCSLLKYLLINIKTSRVEISAKSFKTQFGMLSGPATLCELIELSCLVIISVVTAGSDD